MERGRTNSISRPLPRAESYGQSHVLSGEVPASARWSGGSGGGDTRLGEMPKTRIPAELLTSHGHHLIPGALWRMDTAGSIVLALERGIMNNLHTDHGWCFDAEFSEAGPANCLC